jgi:hypothetical protein
LKTVHIVRDIICIKWGSDECDTMPVKGASANEERIDVVAWQSQCTELIRTNNVHQ